MTCPIYTFFSLLDWSLSRSRVADQELSRVAFTGMWSTHMRWQAAFSAAVASSGTVGMPVSRRRCEDQSISHRRQNLNNVDRRVVGSVDRVEATISLPCLSI